MKHGIVVVKYSSRSLSILAIFASLFHFKLIFPAILANFSLFSYMASFLSKQFGTVPVNTHTLKSALKEYKAPMAKISLLQREGVILNLLRDLYLCLPEDGEGTYSRELVANHLLHPSYVSYETVLSRAGVIPERVTLLKSSCMERRKMFDNGKQR